MNSVDKNFHTKHSTRVIVKNFLNDRIDKIEKDLIRVRDDIDTAELGTGRDRDSIARDIDDLIHDLKRVVKAGYN